MVAAFTLVAQVSIYTRPADQPAGLGERLERIRSEIRPEQAMDFMRHVYSTDRWFTFPKFQETAEYVKRTMLSIGLKNVELVNVPADGATRFGYWTEPMAWDARTARLELLDPDGAELDDGAVEL